MNEERKRMSIPLKRKKEGKRTRRSALHEKKEKRRSTLSENESQLTQ